MKNENMLEDKEIKNRENIKQYITILKEKFPEYEEDLNNIVKKTVRGNSATLSNLIIFQRNITDENLKLAIKKLIQALMDNPKILRK